MVRAGAWESLAVATTGALTIAYLSSRKIKRTNASGAPPKKVEEQRHDNDELVITMLPLETSDLMMQNVSSISTITWYTGDIDNVKDDLRNRVADILRANPWVGGRLAKRRNVKGALTPSLVYCSNEEIIVSERLDVIYQCCNNDDRHVIPLTRDTPYGQLPIILKSLLVKNANTLLDIEDGSLFRISMVPDCKDPHGRFALIVSLAHCIGDGQTFYNLQNMLDLKKGKRNVVVSLNARNHRTN